MLESLRPGTATIHELNLAGVFPEPAPYRPRELYEALKATPLFDADRGQWNKWMCEEQRVQERPRYVAAQLLGVLTEALFNLEGARELYEKLKATPLYDPEHGQWNVWMSEQQIVRGTYRQVDAQLLGVLVEGQFNPEGARELYARHKTTPLYDAVRGQWNYLMSEKQILHSAYHDAATMLLEVLVEAQFCSEKARERYEQLKSTVLFDHEREQWNGSISEKLALQSSKRYADAQLLGVLAEAQANPEGARAMYEKLKATPLYDAARGQWNYLMSEAQELESTHRHADAQLLGVLVAAKLHATLPRRMAAAVPPLPTTEDW